jgi:hypothetical protein
MHSHVLPVPHACRLFSQEETYYIPKRGKEFGYKMLVEFYLTSTSQSECVEKEFTLSTATVILFVFANIGTAHFRLSGAVLYT